MESSPVQLQIYVEIIDSQPAIWRRIRIPGQTTLPELHLLLQATMGWQNRHPYRFKSAASDYAPIAEILSPETPQLIYTYHLEDGWLHRIRLEQTLSTPAAPSPICLDGAMACPPEGSGGVWGYEELLARLYDPDDPEYVDLWDRVGGEFDPDLFDLDGANQRLSALAH